MRSPTENPAPHPAVPLLEVQVLERLMAALERMASDDDGPLPEGLAPAADCALIAFLEEDRDGVYRVRASSTPTAPTWVSPTAVRDCCDVQTLADTSDVVGWGTGPLGLAAGSAILLPLASRGPREMLVWVHPEPGYLGPQHVGLARRVGSIAQRVVHQRRLEWELRQEHCFMKALLDTLASLVVIMDTNGFIKDLNPSCCERMGYTREQVIGRHYNDFFVDHGGTNVNVLFERLAAGEPRAEHESAWRSRDGHGVWIAWSNSVLRNDDGSVRYVIATGIDVTHRRSMERRLRHSAEHDPLTGVLNRACFQEHLEGLASSNLEEGFTLAFLDLDGFKGINDTRGHAAGDRVLQVVALRLADAVRRNDIVARLGGDEFAVIFHSVSDPDEVKAAADRIRACVERPIPMDDGPPLQVGVSIGVTAAVQGASDVQALLRTADMRMYEDKAGRR